MKAAKLAEFDTLTLAFRLEFLLPWQDCGNGDWVRRRKINGDVVVGHLEKNRARVDRVLVEQHWVLLEPLCWEET